MLRFACMSGFGSAQQALPMVALSCRASRQYSCSDRARRVAARLGLAFQQQISNRAGEQRRLPYMLLILTAAVLRAAEYLF